jgi:hypothetical protein
MMKKLISSLLIFVLIFGMTSLALAQEDSDDTAENTRQEVDFGFRDSDETPDWAKGYIGKMQSQSIIEGYKDGTFRPNAPVKRIEAVVMAVRLMGLEDEAKAEPANTPLHFKDSKQIPGWAKGYVVTALENGLFESSEDKLQAEKPASRIWIVNLLVRALGLEDEALKQMTQIPDFKDVKEIPAGSIGYINVALENGITTGYSDNTFKPNKNVTRGEMAAFLDRTNEGLQEESGALIVQGSITAIAFDDSSVTDDVYADSVDGVISVKTFNEETLTYTISSNLFVQYHNQFILADQLLAGDLVTFVVQNGQVIEANLVDEQDVNTNSNVIEFKLKIESDNEELEYKYENKKGKVSAKIEVESNDQELEIKGEEAVLQVEAFLNQLLIAEDTTEEEIISKVLTALEIERDLIEEFKFKIKLGHGQKLEVKFENDEDADDEKGRDEESDGDSSTVEAGYNGVTSFKLFIFQQDGDKVTVKYHIKDGKAEYETDIEAESERVINKGENAELIVKALLDSLALTSGMDESQLSERIYAHYGISEEDLKEFEARVKFTSNEEVEVEFEKDGEDDEDDE